MSENPEGTPNPLNPMPEEANNTPDTGEELAVGTGALEFTETEIPSDDGEVLGGADSTADNTTNSPDAAAPKGEPAEEATATEIEVKETLKPASFAQTAETSEAVNTSIRIEDASEPIIDEKPTTSSMPEMPVAKPAAPATQNVVDPIMKPVSRQESSFDSLSTSENPGEARVDVTENLVAKDSVVEPANGKTGKKKIFAICAIILVIIAIICGAAAIAIAILNNSGDKVTRAIDRLINRETSSIVAVEGNITVTSDADDNAAYIDIDGTFDTRSTMNKISATVNPVLSNGQDFTVGIDEIENQSGDIFIKVNGLTEILDSLTLITPTDVIDIEEETDTSEVTVSDINKCVDDLTGLAKNCVEPASTSTSELESLLSMFAGVLEVIDDEWILVPGDFIDMSAESSLFSNDTTCLIDAFETLPEYGKDIANKYKANPFITYSTDGLAIAKKNDTLYRLGFDEDKLTAFINSFSNSGFMNELNACAGNLAVNSDAITGVVSDIFANFPTVYAEINDNYDFTRLYFEVTADDDNGVSQTIAADLHFSYPSELRIEEPASYVDMSDLLSNVMSSLLINNGGLFDY